MAGPPSVGAAAAGRSKVDELWSAMNATSRVADARLARVLGGVALSRTAPAPAAARPAPAPVPSCAGTPAAALAQPVAAAAVGALGGATTSGAAGELLAVRLQRELLLMRDPAPSLRRGALQAVLALAQARARPSLRPPSGRPRTNRACVCVAPNACTADAGRGRARGSGCRPHREGGSSPARGARIAQPP